MTTLSEADKIRFWSKVARPPVGCWVWTAGRRGKSKKESYGAFWAQKTMHKAHRISFELTGALIPDGMCVCHKCDNPICCNPAHLFLGTVADNNRDRHEKGRSVIPSTLGLHRDRHPRTKIYEADIPTILALRAEGMTQTKIAILYGTNNGTISRLLKRFKVS